MKKAIITGATGLVGMAVAGHFASRGVETLCLGRRVLSPADVRNHFGAGSNYLCLAMEDIASLAERVDLMTWSPGSECVFFNFAWRGCEKLTDGSFSDQVSNAVYAAEAVRAAKKLGCIKFVNAGTLEETLVERFLAGNYDYTYQSAQMDYALAKLAARDMCKMIAYLEKIDYVHTRLSIPLASDLSRGTYVAATLKKIAEGMSYDAPLSSQLFDIIFLDDVARAYCLIGVNGKNKADYFIGTSMPATLSQYFARFEYIVKNYPSEAADLVAATDTEFFSTAAIHQDTGFVATTRLRDIIEKHCCPSKLSSLTD